MGTDISMLVEVHDGENWTPLLQEIWPHCESTKQHPFRRVPNTGRNYPLFAALADVRNRSGRGEKVPAQAEMSDGTKVDFIYDMDDGGFDTIVPFGEPRGIPKDASLPWVAWHLINPNRHDMTWITLAEVKSINWNQRIIHDAKVTSEEYDKYLEDGTIPEIQARGAGGDSEVVTEAEYAAGKRGPHVTYVDMRWVGGTLEEEAGSTWWAIVAVMEFVALDFDQDRVRLLVSFDS